MVDENATGSVNFCPTAQYAYCAPSQGASYPQHRFVEASIPSGRRERRVENPVESLFRLTDLPKRLDEAKTETLRSWGEGLRTDPRDEVRAAGRAITMLVEELERLNIDLWHARADAREAREAQSAHEPPVPAPESARATLPSPLPAY
jgi:hypothetical protein